jgi:hypothetical protein
LRGLNVVGTGIRYCRPHTTPRQQGGNDYCDHTGSPRYPVGCQGAHQRRPSGRCCMRNLDICWSWGTIIYCPNRDKISKTSSPKTPNLFPGRMGMQPSGVHTVATAPWRPPLEKRLFVLENRSTRCSGTPSTLSNSWSPKK